MLSGGSTRAKILDDRYEQALTSLALPSARDVAAQVRTYLQYQDAELPRKNNTLRLVKQTSSQEPRDHIHYVRATD